MTDTPPQAPSPPTEPDPKPQPKRHKTGRWLLGLGLGLPLGVLGLAAAVLTLAPTARHSATETLLQLGLARAGIAMDAVTVTEMTASAITLEAPSALQGGLTADQLRITYDPSALWEHGRVETIALDGLTLTGSASLEGVELDLLTALAEAGLLAQDPGQTSGADLALPFAALSLTNTTLALDGPLGAATLTADVSLIPDPGGQGADLTLDGLLSGIADLVVQAEATLRADGTPEQLQALIGGTAGPLDVPDIASDVRFAGVATIGLTETGEISLETEGLDLTAEALDPALLAQMPIQLQDMLVGAPLALTVTRRADSNAPLVTTAPDGASLRLDGQASLSMAKGSLTADLTNSLVPLDGSVLPLGSVALQADLSSLALLEILPHADLSGPLRLSLAEDGGFDLTLEPGLTLAGHPHPDMLPPSRIKTLLGLAEDATDRLALQVADQPITLQTTLDRDTLALSPVMLSGALAIREDQTDAPSLLSLRLDEARFDPATVTVSIPDAEVSASRLAPVPGITLDRPVLHLLEGAWSPENPITGSLTLRSGLDIAPDSLADPLTLTGGQVSAQASVALDPLAQTGTVDLSALSITADEVTLSPVRLDSPTLTLSAEATRSAQALEIAKPMVQLTAAGGSLADSPLDPLDLKLAIEGSDAPIIVALKRDNATAPLVTLPEGLTLTSPRVEPLRLLSESGAVQAEAQDPVLTLAGPWPPSAEAPLVAQFSAPSLIAAGTRIETPALTARLADPALGPAVTLTGLLPRLPGEPARLPAATRSSRPLSLSASLEALEEPEAERHRLRGSLSSGNGAIRADLLGRLGRDLQTLDLSFLLKPVVFAPGGRQLGVLYGGPELDGLVQGDLTGSVAAKGQFRLRPPRSKGSPLRQSLTVDLLLEDVSGQIADLDITQINGVVRLTGFDPLRSPVQELAIAEIDAGIPLTGVLVNYQFDGRGNLLVDRASLSLAGGMIATEGLTVPLRSGAPLDIPLSVSGLQLADLARLTELDGLQATGTLSGEIPLQLREDELFIDFATLTSDSPGTLIYIPPADPETIAAGNEGVKLLLLAVDDFHYESLILTIDGSPDGEVEVDLGIAGANPALYDGYPIELNLSVTGAVMELVRKNIRTYTLPGRIQDAMDGFFQ